MTTSVTSEQKDRVRRYYADSIIRLTESIDSEIEKIGGEDMLLQRVDLMEWVYFSQEDIKMFKEVLRLLDGAADVDRYLITAAIKAKQMHYQNGRQEIDRLKREIEKCQQQLEEAKMQLEQDKEAMDVLTSEYSSL